MTPQGDDERPSRGVLVTGASRGIGRAIAHAFAADGCRVAVHYATGRADAERTLADLPGVGHVLVQGDISAPEAATAIAQDAVAQLGGVDVLVNNAAHAPAPDNKHAPATTSYADWLAVWRRMVDVNLLGAANLSWTVAHHLIEQGRAGSIVNVGSRAAFRGKPDFPAYAATKAALHALGQSLAVSLAPHDISVSSVAPGFIATERQEAVLAGERGAVLRADSPFGRVGRADEVAAAVLHLASPEAAWSSGAILDLNGASYLRS